MKKLFTTMIAVLLIAPAVLAQLSENIDPMSLHPKVRLGDEVPMIQMSEVDVETLMAEDEINNATKEGPYRFGEMIETDIEFHNTGEWSTLSNGDRIWRVEISSPGAYSLNFMFDDFYLPEGSMLHIYNQSGDNRLGAFTSKNNHPSREFATFLIAGDHAVIEYYEPEEVQGFGSLGLSTVVHGYRDILDAMDESRGGGSGACNNNVVCPEGAPWENEINAVTRIVLGGGLCSGALVVDVPQTGTPYYLTANHCIGGAGSGSNWVFNFKYETSTCGGSTAPNNLSLTGCVIRANNGGSDFALLELNDDPPSNYEPFFAGWDRSGTASTENVCIHHPAGDPKKISFDDDAATTGTFGGAQCWHIGDWEDGTTEGGSSGSPLFDQNHRVIGQLYGGQASCSNNVNDYYGRFGVSWDGSSSSNRLRDWLDPNDTGANTADGFDPFQPQVAVDAGGIAVSGVTEGAIQCDSVITPVYTLKNYGSDNLTACTIDWEIDNVAQTPYMWTGNLSTNQTEDITFPTINFSPGQHTIEWSITSANNGTDLNANNDEIDVSFEVVVGEDVTVSILTDNYGDETSWEIEDDNGSVVASGDGYGDATQYDVTACLPEGCYTFTIYDFYGDGICCDWGNGNYEVLSPNNEVMGDGDEFGDSESFEFCLPFLCGTFDASVSITNENLWTGGDNGSATVSATGGNPPYTYSWTQPGVGNNATATGLGAGNYTVTVTDDEGCEIELPVEVSNNVGVEDLKLSQSVEVYPNPTSDVLNIEFSGDAEVIDMNITDVVGKTIRLLNVTGLQRTTVDFSNLAEGVYYVNFSNAESKATKKVVYLKR